MHFAGPVEYTSKTWTQTLDPRKHESWKTWNMYGIKIMPDFAELCFKQAIRNVVYCLKVHIYLN